MFGQFGIQNSSPGGAANGVVRKHHKLDVKYTVGPDTPNGNRHTLARVPVQLGLGEIFLVQDQDGPLRRRALTGGRGNVDYIPPIWLASLQAPPRRCG